jgi:hypothetical protein
MMRAIGIMRWNPFTRSLSFAALAACAVLPWMVAARPVCGTDRALAVYGIIVTAAYLGGLAREAGRGLIVSLTALAAGAALAAAARTTGELVLGLGVLLAVGRSGFLYRAPLPRAVVVETLLVGGGLLFSRLLAGHAPLSLVLALWGFFLVQSAYFLVGGMRARQGSGPHPDPFEDAHARALALLDRHGV